MKLYLDKTELLFIPGKASPIHCLSINIENSVVCALDGKEPGCDTG